MRIALIADRLRVEERLLADILTTRGHETELVSPASIHVGFGSGDGPQIRLADQPTGHLLSVELALERGEATTERAALGALLAMTGATVVNRPATTRLLADRLAATRHLSFAGIPLPATVVSFGEAATVAAIETLGYPVLLKSIVTDRNYPLAIVEDRDAAEAIIEHRTVLGDERGVLIQRFIAGPDRSVRLVVVGLEIVAIEQRRLSGWRPGPETAYEAYTGESHRLQELGSRVIERLGSGVYSVEVLEAGSGPVVVGVENLVDFRTIAARGVDIAAAIADFALAQVDAPSEEARRG
jgi:[lysine-biosynthesis-protein LysW]--L-2-aminoadipate ligase